MPEDIPIEDANGNILFEGNTSSTSVMQPMRTTPAADTTEASAETQPADEPAQDGMEKVNIHVKALYDYDAEAESELTIKEGETLLITEKHSSGWWYATNSVGQSGFVPENYVEVVAN